MRWPRRAVAAAMVLGVLWAVGTTVMPAAAQGPTTTTVPDSPQVPVPRIIPQPNSGEEPVDSNEPGGAAQYAVLIGIVGGVGLIAFLVWREARQKQQRRGPVDGRPD